jgi:hypothetical protein
MELKREEASKLGLIAQFSKLKRAARELEEMKESLGQKAKNVAEILLGAAPAEFSEEEQRVAESYQGWHAANVNIGNRRNASSGGRREMRSRSARRDKEARPPIR